MEYIRRKIKLFFVTYGGLLFGTIGVLVIVFITLRGVDYIYLESTKSNLNELSQEEIEKEEQESEKILFISKFIDYCNGKQVEEAYNMLSEKCKIEKYNTIEKFKEEYINKIFTYKKEYKIEKENNLYKIEIIEGILETGNTENRKSIISYYRIEEDILEKTIYIER